tara:strand:+ start:969 stop:1763 length:795 start_codon:yes stop_codon:yes gene_type:complete
MKKYLVIGNPIEHSLSPKLHNYWIKNNNIKAIYEKKKLNNDQLENLVLDIRNGKISGVNVTVPFKKSILPYIDVLSDEASKTQSVNTVYLNKNKIVGHNTDINGFTMSVENIKFNIKGKKILILGAGGVVSSIIYALIKMKASNIIITNRTKSKAENLKGLFKEITLVDWGEMPEIDMIINATSLGLKDEDKIELEFSKIGKNKFFYDLIYNPEETFFLKEGKKLGHKIENGKMMFIYQAYLAFQLWHGIYPKIDNDITNLLRQ